jgi:aspartyl-tRNA(Asn)/glutamyl-tRNA(Gln) amidotransferase subunit B
MVAIRNNAQAVADYKAGKKQSLKFLVGQVMRATRGRANPTLVNQILEKKLKEV